MVVSSIPILENASRANNGSTIEGTSVNNASGLFTPAKLFLEGGYLDQKRAMR